MDVRAVRTLARTGQVTKAPHYHAGRHGIPWSAVLAGLERCVHVDRDGRTDGRGHPLHPRGWYALANVSHHRRLRIDFDLHDDGRRLLLVVTAYHL